MAELNDEAAIQQVQEMRDCLAEWLSIFGNESWRDDLDIGDLIAKSRAAMATIAALDTSREASSSLGRR